MTTPNQRVSWTFAACDEKVKIGSDLFAEGAGLKSASNAAVSSAAHSLAALATDRQMSSESAGSANEAAAYGQKSLAQTHRPLALQRFGAKL